jgi:hypothetical protein
MTTPTALDRPRSFRPPVLPVLAALALLGPAGCATTRAAPEVAWLPEATGWSVRDADPDRPLAWVMYERKAPDADVKELRIVGPVAATPTVVAQAVRRRLEELLEAPSDMERTILRRDDDELVVHGQMSLPFPFDDRAATERTRFLHDPATGVFKVIIEGIDEATPLPDGVLRIPLVRNTIVIAPAADGTSTVTMDSVHDIGGHFPNWIIYQPVCDQLLADLTAVRAFAEHPADAR